MHTKSILTGAITVFSLFAPAASAESLPWDQVAVTFKEPVGDRFVGVIHTVMGTSTVKKASQISYTFRIGDRGNQNDYAVFFAHLPYVKSVQPLPKLSAADREMPDVVIQVDPETRGLPTARPKAPRTRGYVPGQLLVKPKPNVSAQAIANLNQSLGATQKAQIAGVGVWMMALPPNMSVEDAQKKYMASGLFQYAEPNRVMGLPDQPDSDPTEPIGPQRGPEGSGPLQAPSPDNAGPGIFLSPKQIVGNHLLVRFRSGGPTSELINQVYGTRSLERTDADEVRLGLPPSMTPMVAARILRLCPWVSYAEPSYGR